MNQGHLSIEEVNDNIDTYVDCQGAAHGDHAMYVNITRLLFTAAFILAIICFGVGCAAYANRERRVWYRTLGELWLKSTNQVHLKAGRFCCWPFPLLCR